jgi:hypothetical protein
VSDVASGSVVYSQKCAILVYLYTGAILLVNNSSELKEPSVQEREEFDDYREKSYQAQVTFPVCCKACSEIAAKL